MIPGDDRDDELLLAAIGAMGGTADGLATLGWWELLAQRADLESNEAIFAAFRAQGRTLASSPALGGLVAQPFAEALGLEPGSVVAALPRRSRRAGHTWVLVGDVGARDVLFDVPDVGTFLVDASDVAREEVDVPGASLAQQVDVDLAGRTPLLPEEQAARRRALSLRLGRMGIAAEILGSAEQAVAMAVEHAGLREQFGQPIGSFQAVRHLLAWARTDLTAIDASLRKALLLIDDPPPQLGMSLKALAGRNGRRACERSLQVLGGIGFTAEHDHHRHHSRVLLLDALLGTSAELTHDLGAWLRTGGRPDFPRALLVPRAV